MIIEIKSIKSCAMRANNAAIQCAWSPINVATMTTKNVAKPNVQVVHVYAHHEYREHRTITTDSTTLRNQHHTACKTNQTQERTYKIQDTSSTRYKKKTTAQQQGKWRNKHKNTQQANTQTAHCMPTTTTTEQVASIGAYYLGATYICTTH